MIEYIIPGTLLDNLAVLLEERPTALLLRHSVRDPIPDGETGHELPLTETGVELAHQLGEKIRGRLASLHASPVPRCVETAECLRRGAGIDCEIRPDQKLGDPGVFVKDDQLAWKTFQDHSYWELIGALVEGEDLPGMYHGPSAVKRLIGHMLDHAQSAPGLHVFVTHDIFISALVCAELTDGVDETTAPWFLDGVFLWGDDDIHIRYRDLQGEQ